MKKIAVLFPGLGYSCDKPLLYYIGKFYKSLGFEIVRLEWKNLPNDTKENMDSFKNALSIILSEATDSLKKINFHEYSDIVLVGKSVGTVSLLQSEKEFLKDTKSRVRKIILTPIKETFDYDLTNSLVFHGTNDSWFPEIEFQRQIIKSKVILHEIPEANHSLENGNVFEDLETLFFVILKVKEFEEENS